MDKINVYAINLVKRADRKASIVSEFADKEEFQLTIVPAIEHPNPAAGLSQTIKGIVGRASEEDLDYIVFCEDDHTFTSHYSAINLQKAIADAKRFQADVLLGGVSWFTSCIPVGENLNWVEKFSGMQFAVIFKKFYVKMLNTDFAVDYKVSMLSDKIYFIYPFISIQKDFGYSDVTLKNNAKNKMVELFKDSDNLVNSTRQVISFYKKKMETLVEPDALTDFGHMSVTTYILNSNGSEKELSHIHSQFEGRTEFDVRMIKLHGGANTEQTYWMALHKIVQQATDEEDDVIIVCDDDHLFTEAYSRRRLMRHIVEGHQLGTRILCGGIDDFETAIPITQDKFWLRAFKSSSFIVLYQSVFDKILSQPFFKDSSIESVFREITSNKMVMFPFISKRELVDEVSLKSIHPSHEVTSSRLAKIIQIAESSTEVLKQ